MQLEKIQYFCTVERMTSVSISIIIPVFRVSRYIERCLKSVISQTYAHFECILVDDASTDDSIAKCERMIAAYEGPVLFRILRHERNRGLSAARNTGLDASTGDYVLYVDSDDYLSNDCIEKLIAPVLRDKSIEMVLGERLLVSDDGPLLDQRGHWRHQEDLRTRQEVRALFFDRSRYFPAAAWNKLISREFIDRNQLRFEEGRLMEDTLWTFYVMKQLSHLYMIPDITYFYYIRSDSIAHGTEKTELGRHACAIFDTISRNFTPGERGLEAAHYLSLFCRFYVYRPKNKENRVTARRFAEALPFLRYPRERILLFSANVLPHTKGGRECYKAISKWLLRRQ